MESGGKIGDNFDNMISPTEMHPFVTKNHFALIFVQTARQINPGTKYTQNKRRCDLIGLINTRLQYRSRCHPAFEQQGGQDSVTPEQQDTAKPDDYGDGAVCFPIGFCRCDFSVFGFGVVDIAIGKIAAIIGG